MFCTRNNQGNKDEIFRKTPTLAYAQQINGTKDSLCWLHIPATMKAQQQSCPNTLTMA